MRELRAVLFVCCFNKRAVRNYVIACGRCDEEFDSRFVVRVIYSRKPVVRAIRPVVGKYGAVSEFVLLDEKPVRRPPVILDRNPASVAAFVVALKLNADTTIRFGEERSLARFPSHRPQSSPAKSSSTCLTALLLNSNRISVSALISSLASLISI